MTTAQKALWASNSGHVVCDEHGGGYFTAHRRAHPRQRRFVTPLDVWEKVTEADRAWWLEEAGEPMTCESCPQGVKT